jgi:Glycosyltransferase family 87
MTLMNRPGFKFILSLTSLFMTLLIMSSFFERIQIEGTSLAMDWKGLWVGLNHGLEYGNTTGLRIPPWSALVVWPLGKLPFNTSWGVLAVALIVVLLLSVPRAESRWKFLLGIIVVTLSFPTLRVMADGNFEVLVIAGCLLIGLGVSRQNVFALVFGILLATSKIQQTWLLLLLLPIILWRRVSREKIILIIAGLALVGVPSLLWKGQEWINAIFAIQQRGSQMDSSLWATSTHLGIPFVLTVFLVSGIAIATGLIIWKTPKQFSREQIGLMIAASLVLSPYMAGNNFLTLYAVTVPPLLLLSIPAGLGIILLANLPFVFLGNREVLYNWSGVYWTLVVLITWAILIMRIGHPDNFNTAQ